MTTAQYPIRIHERVLPNETAPMPFRVQRACKVLDLVGLPADVVVVKAALGRARFDRDEAQCTLGQHLALEPYEANVGAYCVFTVMNRGTKPVAVEGVVLVEDEQGPAVAPLMMTPADDEDEEATSRSEDSSSRNVSTPRKTSRSSVTNLGDRRARDPENDARVEAIIDGAEMLTGQRVRTSSRKSSGAPSLIRAVRSRRQSRKERMDMARAQVSSTTQNVPGPDDRIFAIHSSYAEMLVLALVAAVPLTDATRTGIRTGLLAAVSLRGFAPNPTPENESRRLDSHSGAPGVSASSSPDAHGDEEPALAFDVGDVIVRMAPEDLERLMEAIDGRAEFTLDAPEAIVNALQSGVTTLDSFVISDAEEVPSLPSHPNETDDDEEGVELQAGQVISLHSSKAVNEQ